MKVKKKGTVSVRVEVGRPLVCYPSMHTAENAAVKADAILTAHEQWDHLGEDRVRAALEITLLTMRLLALAPEHPGRGVTEGSLAAKCRDH